MTASINKLHIILRKNNFEILSITALMKVLVSLLSKTKNWKEFKCPKVREYTLLNVIQSKNWKVLINTTTVNEALMHAMTWKNLHNTSRKKKNTKSIYYMTVFHKVLQWANSIYSDRNESTEGWGVTVIG